MQRNIACRKLDEVKRDDAWIHHQPSEKGSVSGVLEEVWLEQRERGESRAQGGRETGQDTRPASLVGTAACLLREVGVMEGSVQGGDGLTWAFTGFPRLEWRTGCRGEGRSRQNGQGVTSASTMLLETGEEVHVRCLLLDPEQFGGIRK